MDVQNSFEIKMEPLTYNVSGILEKELEDELMKFTKKDVDSRVDALMVEQIEGARSNSDMEVNITECTKSLGTELLPSANQDTTESSSSFEDTSLGVDNISPFDDSEGISDLRDDAPLSPDFGGSDDRLRMRKRGRSSHWKNLIQPLMWRCKWVELQIKKLQNQAQQCDQELEAYYKRKQTRFENHVPECGVKSLPWSQENARSDIMRRKRRRMTEATTDVAAYMSRHNLFSYYETKNSSESAAPCNRIKNPANLKVNNDDDFLVNEELLSTKPGDDGASFEQLLYKIHLLNYKVSNMKDRVDKVVTENAGRFPCTDTLPLTMPFDDASPSNNGERIPLGTYIASQLLSGYNMADALASDSAVASHRDTPDVNGHVEDGALIDNQRVKDEINSFSEVRPNDRLGNNEGVRASEEGTSSHSTVRSPMGDEADPTSLPPQKTRSIAKLAATKGKKKKGRRRGGNRWSRKPSG
ncbi:uncharacterized protein LOC127246602 [Andrographis paniculata]|uniref:uncharacterized protein LOC127246602 n=1 Tax=Andrographis paniculata TaxID=175694 RepID=UPI0021E738DE|nr:uncharacterized protein LOC127246602 [Andrographis paniculata]XP_051124029.1 uncharacterized protein LOC127246602 [Andrographis paniculata]XP_051124037.1 uncharacterized protein LOC127246602 [Andrographis paniculata]